MLRIRLSMGGVRKRPVYKIVVADGRYPRDGKFIEKVGSYNPLLPKDKKERIKVEFERIKYWISKGAQPTLRVSRILGEMQLMPMPKPGNNPLKAIPKKDRKKNLNLKQAEEYLTSTKSYLESIKFKVVYSQENWSKPLLIDKNKPCIRFVDENKNVVLAMEPRGQGSVYNIFLTYYNFDWFINQAKGNN